VPGVEVFLKRDCGYGAKPGLYAIHGTPTPTSHNPEEQSVLSKVLTEATISVIQIINILINRLHN